jgi:hypothetical protein
MNPRNKNIRVHFQRFLVLALAFVNITDVVVGFKCDLILLLI